MFKKRVESLLKRADITLNGSRPWDIQVHDEKGILRAVQKEGLTGLGESYIKGMWDTSSIDQLFFRLMKKGLSAEFKNHPHSWVYFLNDTLRNRQTQPRAPIVGEKHYDLPPQLFEKMLGPTLQYSCGYWKDLKTTPNNLNAAQEQKMKLIAQKLGIRRGMRVLDIGCGWGGLARYLASKHGAKVVGVTISKEQAVYAKKLVKGMPVDIHVMDYRDVPSKFSPFDRVVSVGMFEHVGPKNYDTYLSTAKASVKDEGLFLLHTIGAAESFPNVNHSEVIWVDRHIFPNLVIPSLAQIMKAVEGKFVVEDVHNFGAGYDPTLMAWTERFKKSWPELRKTTPQFKEMTSSQQQEFYRMWTYYLGICAGSFRARNMYELWQIVLSKHGVPGGYQSLR